ncbi:MAG: serine hydrolase [Candidatus Levybacteria bacterium]|nr:serine hydrolase [Candidatus Levybacteria bacterium]
MRKIIILLFYSFFLILLGRNLLFIPQIQLGGAPKVKDPDTIRDEVITFLKTQKGDFNVYYEDLKSGDSFSIHGSTVLTAASINKLPIVAYLYHLASKKEIDLQETIVIQKSDIQDYGTGSLRYEKPGQPYTLQHLAKLSLKESDNTAAHVLTIRLGEENIQSYAYQIGMGSTSMVDNDTTARDIGKFYEMLYHNKIANQALSQELLGYMEDTEFEDRIPPLLPRELHVYHKTGDGVNFIHDGGIISNGENPFTLVVLSSNIADEKMAKNTISKIALLVFEGRGKK